MLTSALWHHPIIPLQWGVVLGVSLVAAIWDLATHRIPNLLTGLTFLAGLIAAFLARGTAGLTDSFLGAVLLALPFIVLFFLGGGAGDAKLMGAIGAWLGVANGVIVLAAVVVTGAAVGLTYALLKNRISSVVANLRGAVWSGLMAVSSLGRVTPPVVIAQDQAPLVLPYGFSIFLGTCIAAAGRFLWFPS